MGGSYEVRMIVVAAFLFGMLGVICLLVWHDPDDRWP